MRFWMAGIVVLAVSPGFAQVYRKSNNPGVIAYVAATPGGTAVATTVTVDTVAFNTANAQNLTASITVGASANGVCVLAAGKDSGDFTTGVTFANTPLPLVADIPRNGGFVWGGIYCSTYTQGSGTRVAYASSTAVGLRDIVVVTLNGVNQTSVINGVGVANDSSGGVTSISTACLNTVVGDLVLGFSDIYATQGMTPGTGQIRLADQDNGSFSQSASSGSIPGATVTNTWTFSSVLRAGIAMAEIKHQ